MNELSLFELAPAGRVRHSDPINSVTAARPARVSMTTAILEAFQQYGALTDDELSDVLRHYPAPSVKTRRSQLLKARRLAWTGQNRPSRTGSPMQVWTLSKGM